MWTIPVALQAIVDEVENAHSCGVARLARQAARTLGLPPELAYVTGLVHDVGKLEIPVQLLGQARPLDHCQRLLLRTHPVEGERIVKKHWSEAPAELLHAVRHHHERLDGSGYPDQLTEMPLLSWLIAGCDVYDALRTERSYRAALSVRDAVASLRLTPIPMPVITAVIDAAMFFEVTLVSSVTGESA